MSGPLSIHEDLRVSDLVSAIMYCVKSGILYSQLYCHNFMYLTDNWYKEMQFGKKKIFNIIQNRLLSDRPPVC